MTMPETEPILTSRFLAPPLQPSLYMANPSPGILVVGETVLGSFRALLLLFSLD